MVKKVAETTIRVKLMVNWHVYSLDIAIGSENFVDVVLRDILSELFNDNLGALKAGGWTPTSATSASTPNLGANS